MIHVYPFQNHPHWGRHPDSLEPEDVQLLCGFLSRKREIVDEQEGALNPPEEAAPLKKVRRRTRQTTKRR